jgi:hypothetical protein
MMEAVRTSETSVDNHFTRQNIPEDNSEHSQRNLEDVKYRRLVVKCINVVLIPCINIQPSLIQTERAISKKAHT